MKGPGDQEDLRSLEVRLEAARQRHRGEQGKPRRLIDSNGAAAGFRVAVDLISGLAVGVAIGIVLDYWLGTSPWCLILFFFLGSGAALMNVIRTAKSLEAERKRRLEEGEKG
ncbi:MAG: AtpZ/AtpI family protein [Rhodospirillales bacterium]|nr:AtpZ/AtpI family protein [Rhodospirillales bacterium]